MNAESQIFGLSKLGEFINNFFDKNPEDFNDLDEKFKQTLLKAEIENPWFTLENQQFALKHWAHILTEENLKNWLKNYTFNNSEKRVGLILAGNIPMVGFHDVISVLLSQNIPIIKLSSKDSFLIPFLLKLWEDFSENNIQYEIVDRLKDFNAVIATGSNNTARYLEYYFKDYKKIIRKNRTSVAVIKGDESNEELQKLAEDIFIYFGLGCRNVTHLYLPEDFKLDRLFENFLNFKDVINHNKYANNYEYNKAIYLLNMEVFWDNNFVMLKENIELFSPITVVYFSRYKNIEEVGLMLTKKDQDIQCVVAKETLGFKNSVNFGDSQRPGLNVFADNVNTLKFLENI